MSSSTEMTATTQITPEALQKLCSIITYLRQEFIHTYNIQPLVYSLNSQLERKPLLCSCASQTATNVFICSLAVSDLLITFFCIPFTLLQNISSEWLGGVLVCKTVPFVQTTAIVTGILTMTCIAVERYQGIVYPLKMKREYTPKRAYKLLGLMWMAAVMVGSPMLFVQQLEVKYDFLYDLHHVCCQERWRSLQHRQIYTTFMMVALFLLPLAAMLFMYSRIGVELWIRKHDLEKSYDEVTVTMIIAVVQAIGFSNSFNNPIVYAFMNENFKKSCLATLSLYLRRPGRQGGARERANVSVHFSRHLKPEAFSTNTGSRNTDGPHTPRNRHVEMPPCSSQLPAVK
ncbi:Pyroglutamylated RFamide peptide receptor AQ27 G-protein coupled receptor 103 [Triplophysa tibetana]|uniref:Pyroglutamylated RFamide peptide receptor AQ27 G-protein coupled receptor 103 n=1 Tax=Triplophysa tibetana TaxID=1572043 RepID=A0A5A9PXB5_9TELE|nr:Pyroglutamylated RFamide peptide receptor AQ27 G-protein coupled receptor 103 [Triplophysa tibetana]